MRGSLACPTRWLFPLLLGVQVHLPLPAQAGGEDWPRFLGPRGDGSSSETGLLEGWSEEGPPLVWERSLGRSFSPPVTAAGRIVVFHRIRGQEVVECLEAGTGRPVWKQAYPTRYRDRYGYNNGPRSSPAIDGDRVYTFGAEGKLTCLEFSTGRILWQRWINRDYRVPQNFFGVGSAPVVEGNRILVNAGGDGAGVLAVDKHSGETVWKTGDDEASYSTPAVVDLDGRRVAMFLTRGGFLAVDAADGRELYRYPFRSRSYESVNAATPVVVGNRVFLSATYNTGAVLLELGSQGLTEVWRDRMAMQNHWATSLHRDGYLYGVDGRHEGQANLRCLEFLTGAVRWQSPRDLGRSGFVLAEGRLILLGERGDLALVELNPDAYREKARARVLTYPCWAPPVLSHGLLYLRNETRLICLDLRKK